jgi:hypothetical protein
MPETVATLTLKSQKKRRTVQYVTELFVTTRANALSLTAFGKSIPAQ